MYTNDNWFVILLSRVYFGNRVTEMRHFSPLKTNEIAYNSKHPHAAKKKTLCNRSVAYIHNCNK